MSTRKTFTIGDIDYEPQPEGTWSTGANLMTWYGPEFCGLADAHCAALGEIERLKAENEKATETAGYVEILRADEEQLQQDCEVMAGKIERLKADCEVKTDEIERLNGLHASGQKELEDLVNQLCDFDKRLEHNDAEIKRFKKEGYEKDAEIERLKAEIERLQAAALEMGRSRSVASEADRGITSSMDSEYTTKSLFYDDRQRDVFFRGLWIGTVPDVHSVKDFISRHKEANAGLRTVAPRSDLDYTMRTADGEDYGHPDDRTQDVYYRGERIGSAPDRASGRALIDRHKEEQANNERGQDQSDWAKIPLGYSIGGCCVDDERPPHHDCVVRYNDEKIGTAEGWDGACALIERHRAQMGILKSQHQLEPEPKESTEPAVLSEEEQTRWIEKLDQEITDSIHAGTQEFHILAHIRRIVHLLR